MDGMGMSEGVRRENGEIGSLTNLFEVIPDYVGTEPAPVMLVEYNIVFGWFVVLIYQANLFLVDPVAPY